jgi:hypothetical protein
MIWFWHKKPLSPEDREIRDSILSLKTLKVRDGRISVDPSEVLDQPGYLEARRQAAQLVHGRLARPAEPTTSADWAVVDALGMDAFVIKLSQSLQQSRSRGLSLTDALTRLKFVPNELTS